MEGKKNLCAMIPAELHARIMAEKEEWELNTLAEYVERIFAEHFEGGNSMKAERTLAVQIPAELFERLKEYLVANNLKHMPMIGRGKFFFNFGFAIFFNIDICLKQVTDLQHGSPVKWVSVPMANLTECLIQLIEKGCVVFQILFENRKLFFYDHIQPARFEERLGYLWQADH